MCFTVHIGKHERIKVGFFLFNFTYLFTLYNFT